MKNPEAFAPLEFKRIPLVEQRQRAESLYAEMSTRRSVRDFSSEQVPVDILLTAIRTAAAAPSGANLQPWHFVLVSDPVVKHRIREAAEEEEKRNYESRFPDEWKNALAPLGTSWRKEFLDVAPFLIVVFQAVHGADGTGGSSSRARKHYYVAESVGIATGFLLASLHHAGLATLTHTPSPMNFLNEILGRPANEKPFVLIPVGYPAEHAKVPVIVRKGFDQIATVIE